MVTGRRELALAPAIVAVKAAARRDNPSLPRHGDEEMWDPNLVLDYWRAHPPSTVAEKRARAVSLVMLAIYCRPSDLARFSVAHTVIEGDTLRYRIRGPKERRNANYLTPVQRLEMLPADSADQCARFSPTGIWDSISDLERADDPRGVIYSLSRRDGKVTPLSAERLSKVMAEVMHAAGVPTVFTGGSARSAGSSHALDAGMDVDHVLRRGRWSSRWVFNKFYNRARIKMAESRSAAAATRQPTSALVRAADASGATRRRTRPAVPALGSEGSGLTSLRPAAGFEVSVVQ